MGSHGVRKKIRKRAASHSPQLEVFRKKGIEVLQMYERVEEWMMVYLTEFNGKHIKSVAKGDIDLSGIAKEEGDKAEPEEEKGTTALDDALLKKVAEALGDQVGEVRSSQRLTDSASYLVLGDQEMALHAPAAPAGTDRRRSPG